MRHTLLIASVFLGYLGAHAPAQAADRPFVVVLAPNEGGQSVPTNTGIGLLFGVAPDDLTILENGGLLRDESGTLLGPQWSAQRGLDGGAIVRSEPLDLEQDTTYELLTRLVPCTARDMEAVCKQDQFAVLSTFTTGAIQDTTPPRVELAAQAGPDTGTCSFSITLSGKDDQTPGTALRFAVDGVAQEGATIEAFAGLEPSTIKVSAIDLSGNRSEELSVALPACSPENVPRDVVAEDDWDCVGRACGDDQGCSVTSTSARSGEAWSLLIFLSYALTLLFRRRGLRLRAP